MEAENEQAFHNYFYFSFNVFFKLRYSKKKNDPVIKTARADSGMTVKDPSFKFENIKKVILYNEVEDEDSKMILIGLASKFQEKGVEAQIDNGESTEYRDEQLRIRTYKDLMGIYFRLYVLKPGGQKTNEEIVAEIKADTIEKLVNNTIAFIYGN